MVLVERSGISGIYCYLVYEVGDDCLFLSFFLSSLCMYVFIYLGGVRKIMKDEDFCWRKNWKEEFLLMCGMMLCEIWYNVNVSLKLILC